MLSRARAWIAGHPITTGFVIIIVLGSLASAWAFDSIHAQANRSHRLAVENHALIVQSRQQLRRLAADEYDLEHVNAIGTHGSCQAINELRNGIVMAVQNAVTRSEVFAQAAIASPSTSDALKLAATVVLAQAEQQLLHLNATLPLEHCPGLSVKAPPIRLPRLPVVTTTVGPRLSFPPPTTTTTRPPTTTSRPVTTTTRRHRHGHGN